MLSEGSTLGRYRILGLLGHGGMGAVYRAHDPLLDRQVALKTLRADHLLDANARRQPGAESRFLREARASARLRHASVVTIYDVGFVDGVPFIAMELVEGKPLRSRLHEPRVPLSTRLHWLIDIASALASAHAHGLVHRDVKPENVMIPEGDDAKVLDFGIARRTPGAPRTEDSATTLSSSDGQLFGTHRYMAPEQFAGAAVDPRADQYAWGVVAYEVLCGMHPADAAGLPPLCPAAMVHTPRPLDAIIPGLPLALAELVSRAMRFEPERRFPSMDEVLTALEAAAALGPSVLDALPDPQPALEAQKDAGAALDTSDAACSTRTLPADSGAYAATSQARDAPDTASDLLGGRYEVLGELGRGGGGVVFRVRDVKADQIVALKLLRHEDGSEERHQRFRRELQLARKITHPNVVRIHDLVELPGRFGLSMELVKGESLDRRIARGALSRDEIVTLAVDLAQALAAAHEAGVLHRDLKPANVLLREADGRAVVTDFGVSRALDEEGASAGPVSSWRDGTPLKLTREGVLVGTPEYMAPEQLEGTAEVGPASDVYALGLVLYEAATGVRPHAGRSIAELRRLRSETPPRALRKGRPDLPKGLCEAVDRALALEPRNRFSNGVDFLAALRGGPSRREPGRATPWVVGAALVAAGAIGVAIFGHLPSPASSTAAHAPTLAGSTALAPGEHVAGPLPRTKVLVLGIDNHTAEPVFDGTLDAVLVKALYRSLTLDPVGGSELRAFAEEVDPQSTVGEALAKKVGAMTAGRVVTVRGAVTPKGPGYSIAMRAVDALTGNEVTAATLEAADADRVVPTMGLLACRVRAALGETVPAEPVLAERTSMSPSVEADHEFVLGRELARDALYAEAIPHFTRAVSLDPEFAGAHVSLGLTLWSASDRNEASTQLNLAFKGIDRMGDRERLKFLCDYYATFGEYDRAIPECEALLARWPGDLQTEISLSVTYAQNGDPGNALEVGRRVAAEHPRNVLARTNLLNFCLIAGEFDCTETEARRLMGDFPRLPPIAFNNLGAASALLGHRREALAAYDQAEASEPNLAAYGRLDLAFAEGRLDDAARLARALASAAASQRDLSTGSEAWTMLAQVLLRRRDIAGARAAAEKALSDGEETRLLYLAAHVCIASGCDARASALASRLGQSLAADERLYAKLLRAEALRQRGKAREAITGYEEAIRVQDTWFSHYGLARAYLDLRAYPEAYSELQKCLTRRGEAANFWIPSVYLVTPVTYYLGRAQEGIGSPDAAATYRTFLAMEPDAQGDPLADDARKRAGVE